MFLGFKVGKGFFKVLMYKEDGTPFSTSHRFG